MATDATGTPTTLGIPTFNTAADAPSGLGFNAAMAVIDGLLAARVTTSSATLVQSRLVSTDANTALKITGNGDIQWGAGGASALDTKLHRYAANALKTDGDFHVGQALLLDGLYSVRVGGNATGFGSNNVVFDNSGAGLPGAITGGGVLYVAGGVLYFRGAGNIITVAGP